MSEFTRNWSTFGSLLIEIYSDPTKPKKNFLCWNWSYLLGHFQFMPNNINEQNSGTTRFARSLLIGSNLFFFFCFSQKWGQNVRDHRSNEYLNSWFIECVCIVTDSSLNKEKIKQHWKLETIETVTVFVMTKKIRTINVACCLLLIRLMNRCLFLFIRVYARFVC